MRHDNCPHCGTSLIGEKIPCDQREFFGNKTHFRREIGLEFPEVYDGVIAYKCPDCKKSWKAGNFKGSYGDILNDKKNVKGTWK